MLYSIYFIFRTDIEVPVDIISSGNVSIFCLLDIDVIHYFKEIRIDSYPISLQRRYCVAFGFFSMIILIT